MRRILEIRQRRVEHFARIKARRAQKIKDAHDRREVQRDLALIKSPASKMSIKDLIERSKKKAKVRIITDEQAEVEIDEESDEQYNYSDQEDMEMEAEIEAN